MKFLNLTLLAAGLAVGSVAHAQTIDFNSDVTGAKANGFVSVDSALVSFTDSLGAELQLFDYGAQSHGQALAVFGDDPSALVMNFTTQINALSLEFGNDDAGWSAPGDYAQLTLFLGAVQVGQVDVVMNRDDVMNQSIGFSGLNFDSATFQYRNANGGINLIEIVDNITFRTAGNAVPEPSTYALFGAAALLGLVGFRRFKK